MTRTPPTALLLAAAVTVTAACSPVTAPAAPADDTGLQAGRGIYIESCAACHGTTGTGGDLPNTNLAVTELDNGQIAEIVAGGRGPMPAFGQLEPDQVAAVADYTTQILAGS